jgi:hypothetical protein
MLILFVAVALVMAFALAWLGALGIVVLLREASRDAVSRLKQFAESRRAAARALGGELTPAAPPDGRRDETSPAERKK